MVMFAALSLDQERKGGDLLVRALQHLPETARRNLVLLLAGGNGTAIGKAVGIPSIDLGVVERPETMAAAYCAADLFVSPTRADALPLVLIEAMACGTPLVAFDVGGVPGLVRPGASGYLARPEDPADFARGIAELLGDETRRRTFGTNCRSIALTEYSASAVVARHIQLYETLAAANAAPVSPRRRRALSFFSRNA